MDQISWLTYCIGSMIRSRVLFHYSIYAWYIILITIIVNCLALSIFNYFNLLLLYVVNHYLNSSPTYQSMMLFNDHSSITHRLKFELPLQSIILFNNQAYWRVICFHNCRRASLWGNGETHSANTTSHASRWYQKL